MDRFKEFQERHPRLAIGTSAAGILLTLIGLAGLPGDVESWGAVFQAIDSNLGRWLLVVFGIGVVAAVVLAWRLPEPHEWSSAHAAEGDTLAELIDNMIREGRELVSELSAPIQPEKLNWVAKVEAGTPPPEWQEKADAFRQRAHDLLVQRSPALLPDYRDGCNNHIRRLQENGKHDDPGAEADTRSNAEKTLVLANYERRVPAREVEVCLEGLARARKAI